MRRIMAFVIAMALLAVVPAVAYADNVERDTQTEAIEVATEGDNTAGDDTADDGTTDDGDTGTKGTPSSSTSGQKAAATGDDMLIIAVPCLALAAISCVAAGVAFKRSKAAKKE